MKPSDLVGSIVFQGVILCYNHIYICIGVFNSSICLGDGIEYMDDICDFVSVEL